MRLARQRKEEKKRVGAASAKALGPVHELYDERPVIVAEEDLDLYHQLLVKSHVKALPEAAMEVFFASDGLMCQTENDVYTLLCFWVAQSSPDTPREAKYDVFARLAHRIRYHHLSLSFLSEFVSRCDFANKSGMISSIMRQSHILRCLTKYKAAVEEHYYGKPRAQGIEKYTFRSKILLEDLLKVEESLESVRKCVGFAFGFPLIIEITQNKQDGKNVVGAFIKFGLPSWGKEISRWSPPSQRHISRLSMPWTSQDGIARLLLS